MDTELNDAVLNDAMQRAREVIGGADITIDALRDDARFLRKGGQTALVGELLTTLSRRALYDGWRTPEHADLAMRVLRDHQQFGYARRLLGRVRSAGQRQRAAAPAARAVHLQGPRAARRPAAGPGAEHPERGRPAGGEHGRRDARASPERSTSGAGRWTPSRSTSTSALWCYRRGFEQEGDPERWYAGINAAFVADRLAGARERRLGGRRQAEALREQADGIRTADRRRSARRATGEWDDATLGEALFGLGRFDERPRAARRASRRSTKDLWRQETTAMQLAALARPARTSADDPDARVEAHHGAASGGHAGRGSARVDRQGRPRAVGRRVPRVAVPHRRARAARGVQRAAPRRGAVVRVRRLDRRRLLLPQAARAAAEQAGRARSPTRTTSSSCSELADEFLAGVRRNLRGRLVTDSPTTCGCSARRTRAPTARASCSRSSSTARCATTDAGRGGCRDLLVEPAGAGRRLHAALRELAARGEGADPRAQRDDAQHRPHLAVHRDRGWASRRARSTSAWTPAGACGASTTATRRDVERPAAADAGQGGRRVGVRARPVPADHAPRPLRRRSTSSSSTAACTTTRASPACSSRTAP